MTDTLNRDDTPADAPLHGTDDLFDGPRELTREERTAQRREQVKRRKIVGWVLLGLLVVLIAAGGYVVWGTSVLGVKNVTVSASGGALDVGLRDEVTAAAGITTATPLIRVDLSAAEARVEAVPGVADATVSRHWPDTIGIEVTPRVPLAVVDANAALYLMDDTGLPYLTVAAKPAGLIELRLATPGAGDPATMAGLTVIRALPETVAPSVTSVTAVSPYDITVQLGDGRSIVWGDTSDSDRKAQILPAVLGRDGTVFDVSNWQLVSVR